MGDRYALHLIDDDISTESEASKGIKAATR